MKLLYNVLVSLLLFSTMVFARQPDTLAVSLDELLNEAEQHNEILKQHQVEIEGSQALLQQAEGEFKPKVDAVLNYGYQDIVPGFKKIMLGNIEHDIQPFISVSQTLYSGGRLKQAKLAAEAGVQIQKASFQNQKINLKYQVTLFYYQLQALQSQRQILRENRRLLETHQKYAKMMVEAGRMSQLELNRIAVSITDLEGKLLKLNNDYLATSNQLSVSLGRPPEQIFIPGDSLQIIPFEVLKSELLAAALEKNPAWQRLQWDSKMAEAKIAIQQAARMPQVSASAWFGYEFGFESFSFDDNKRYFVGLNAKIPIYTGGIIQSKIDQAQSNLNRIEWQQSYFKKSLEEQLRSSMARLEEMKDQINIQTEKLTHAQKSYRLALIEYHAGRRSNTDLLDIQKDLINSQLSLNEAQVNYNRTKAGLKYLMGVL